jgi:hypothetical protein
LLKQETLRLAGVVGGSRSRAAWQEARLSEKTQISQQSRLELRELEV